MPEQNEWQACKLRENVDSNIQTSEIFPTLALKEQDSRQILFVFPPEKNWSDVRTAARIMECDIVELMVENQFEILPEMRVYRAHDEISAMPSFDAPQKSPSARSVSPTDFPEEFELGPFAERNFRSASTITFLGISPVNSGEVFKLFKRGTPSNQLSMAASATGSDIVFVRARATFKPTGFGRLVNKQDDLKFRR